MRSFSGRKASCVVCQFITYNEKVAKKYEVANATLQENVLELQNAKSEITHSLTVARRKINTLESTVVEMESLRAQQNELREEIARTEEYKERMKDAEKEAKRTLFLYLY